MVHQTCRRAPPSMLMRRLLPSLASLVLVAGCHDLSPGPDVSDALPQASETIFTSVAGKPVSESAMLASASELARRVALSLNDADVRAAVYEAVRSSPYRESKVHLASFLGRSGIHNRVTPRVRDALDERAGGNDSRPTQEILGSIVDLEAYLPVPAHRLAWTGGTDLLVATAVRDHVAPTAFDLAGNRVTLSADTPPSTPVLAIVPVETDFSRLPSRPQGVECDPGAIVCDEEDPVGGNGLPTTAASGVWMNRSEITNIGQYEGWLMGGPELEMILASEVVSSGGFDDERQCSGEYASSINTNNPGVRHPDYDFNQDNDVWTGLVKLSTISLLDDAQLADNGTTFMVWEDDNDACRVRKGGEFITYLGAVISSGTAGARAALKEKPDIIGVVLAGVALATASFRALPSLNSDDFVGFIVAKDAVGASFPIATHAIFDEDLQVVGNVNLIINP